MKNKNKDLLKSFINWARDCGEDAWYIFEQTEEAIEKFTQQPNSNDSDHHEASNDKNSKSSIYNDGYKHGWEAHSSLVQQMKKKIIK